MSLFEKFIENIENSDNSQSFKLVTNDNKPKNKKVGCLLVIICYFFLSIVHSCTSDTNTNTNTNINTNNEVEQTYVYVPATEITTTKETNEVSTNPLLNAEVKVMKSDEEYAIIELSSDDFDSLTKVQYYEFYNNILLYYELDYFSIIVDDGTGIYFENCDKKVGVHGLIDEKGQIIEEDDLLVNGEFISRSEYEETTETEMQDNPLMSIPVKSADIPKIDGKRAYIEISKQEFELITDKQYLEFCNTVVATSNNNYFTIDFEDGTGICYAGCFIYDADYGTLDSTGAVVEKLGSIQIDIENDTVSSDTFTFSSK